MRVTPLGMAVVYWNFIKCGGQGAVTCDGEGVDGFRTDCRTADSFYFIRLPHIAGPGKNEPCP